MWIAVIHTLFARLTSFPKFTGFAWLTMLARLTLFACLTGFAMLPWLLLALIRAVIAIALMLGLATVTVAAVTEIGLGLLLHRNEARLLAEIREALAVIVEIVRRRHVVDVARLRLVLAELLLRGGNQAEIVLGMLVIVLGGHRIAGGAGVARELDVFFGHMGGGAADLDVRPI